MLLAQITDLHIRRDDSPLSGRIVTRPYTAAAVDAVNARAPDAVFVTGDLTDTGTPEEYALLRAELDRLTVPYFVIAGNHDRHGPLRDAFSDHSYLPADGPLNWVIDGFPVRVIGLDTVIPGRAEGHLAPETLEFLDRQLSASDRPTIVGLHHPPFPTGMLDMDGIMCLNGADLEPIIARHPQVERVISGHHHRPVSIRWGGTVGMIAPSVAHQVVLDFEERDVPCWVLEPPAILLHRWTPETGVITHTSYIDTFGGPQSFAFDPDYPPM
ncbi:MAG: phosphodiesterase [Pseudomonadota bacterium]